MQTKPTARPPQHQNHQPGLEAERSPPPAYIRPSYHGSGKLEDKVALVTGGDSGQPSEVASAFVFLASEDASYITGQAIHPNGGEVLNTWPQGLLFHEKTRNEQR